MGKTLRPGLCSAQLCDTATPGCEKQHGRCPGKGNKLTGRSACATNADSDLARTTLEAVALDANLQQRLSSYQLRTLLGIYSRYELDGFLNERQLSDHTLGDFENNPKVNHDASVDSLALGGKNRRPQRQWSALSAPIHHPSGSVKPQNSTKFLNCS